MFLMGEIEIKNINENILVYILALIEICLHIVRNVWTMMKFVKV